MEELYMVLADGRPLRRGLSKAEAEHFANYMANGSWKKRANEKRRLVEYNVRPDREVRERNYQLYKEGFCG